MTLAEKILQLRTAQNLSQGDLAERLEVSRQSVSKWETGQSVPDLDKIIKLADLFGVSVDQLVREEARSEPERPQPTPEPQVIYVEKRAERTAAQITGICLMVLGCITTVLGLLANGIGLLIGLAIVVISLPLVLARKHPWLSCGWVIIALCYAVFSPYWTATPGSLAVAVRVLIVGLSHPEHGLLRGGIGIGTAIALVRGLLTITLLIFTVRAWRRRKK